ncbi:MAG: hypothetical protein IKF38_03150 [Clostridia bacterium]|nr:hypothetical protein [Clostridia bacterium]
MFYTNLYIIEKSIIPQKLLNLFVYYEDDIIKNLKEDTYLEVNESSEKYEILNIKKSEKSFNELLFEFIDKSSITDVELYKRANIDRRLFSKIRSYNKYHPSFGTVTLLALSLNLSCNDYEKLLNSASYSLPQNSYINITLKYCFDEKIYDINRVDEILYDVCGKVIKEL